jgi:hypothetical protein
MNHAARSTLLIVLIALASATVTAEEVPTAAPAPQTPWEERPSRAMVSIGYPQVLHIGYSYAVLPTVRVGGAFIGLPPFLFGGSVQGEYLLTHARSGEHGYVTVSSGIEAMLLKYNFGIVGIQPNDIDWGIGPTIAVDVGFGWFSAGAGVSVLAGDWRSLERDIAPDVTPSKHLAVSFTLPRLSVSW